MSEEKIKIVGTKSNGYNYKYTSLGDLALSGVDIPPMRVATLVDGNGTPVIVDGQPVEYVEALVNEEWIRGARIVIPKESKMNAAQLYGSALTYARRYTALTVLGIVTDDDSKLEVRTEADQKALDEEKKAELKAMYDRAGGKDFEKWFNDSTPKGFDGKAYMSMKATLTKQLNKLAEEGSLK
jgi:hypothetical protein